MKRLAFLLALAIASPAIAQNDPRVREVVYRPGTVYTLRVMPGFVAAVVLSSDDRIQSVAIGNSSAWDVTPSRSGDHLFIRPLANGVPTNVEIVTDLRHYSLLLQTTFEGDPEAAFQLRFLYGEPLGTPTMTGQLPPQPDTVMSAPAPMENAPATVVAAAEYRITGDRLARPLFVSDDGQRTIFTFDDTIALPAIYGMDEHDNEVLVTTRQVPEGWAVDGVWPQYRLRVGKATAKVSRNPKRITP